MSTKRKVVIDCDPGNDDAMAILMALSDPDVDVIAITCVEGNTNVKQTGLNALRTLKIADSLNVPVFVGCSGPMIGHSRSQKPCSEYHGKDGLGDVPDATAPGEEYLQEEHGVLALLRLSKEYAGELNIVAIGPLTNVAMAIRMDPDFGRRLVSCFIMGGNYQGRGNVTVSAEFNFYFDPEAAYMVLNQLLCPITLLPWETCIRHGLTWESYYATRQLGTPKSDFLLLIDGNSVGECKRRDRETYYPADEAAMACFLNNDVIVNSEHVYVTVELGGLLTSGQMIVDWQGKLGRAKNATIITEMNQSLYESVMMRALK